MWLGPTKDISPRKTLYNWGNSSMPYPLINLPILSFLLSSFVTWETGLYFRLYKDLNL